MLHSSPPTSTLCTLLIDFTFIAGRHTAAHLPELLRLCNACRPIWICDASFLVDLTAVVCDPSASLSTRFTGWRCHEPTILVDLFQMLLSWKEGTILIYWFSKIWNHAVRFLEASEIVSNTLRSLLLDFFFLLCLKCPYQIDTLLNRAHWSNLMVHFHRFQRIRFIGIHSSMILNGFVEEFFLAFV